MKRILFCVVVAYLLAVAIALSVPNSERGGEESGLDVFGFLFGASAFAFFLLPAVLMAGWAFDGVKAIMRRGKPGGA